MIKGIIFDLDGTLVNSKLDFKLIRRDLGLREDQLILETVETLIDEEHKLKCHEIIKTHELSAAAEATLIEGVDTFLSYLDQRAIPRAIHTRNFRLATDQMLNRLKLDFEYIYTREDGPPKPDPQIALNICEQWELDPAEMLFIGDYLFDIETGKNAGMKTALYVGQGFPDYHNLADIVFKDYAELQFKIERGQHSWP